MKKYWFMWLVAVSLVAAFAAWPYVYYQLLRWVVCGTGAYAAYINYKSERKVWTWVFVITAILFNPIAPFYIHRDTWGWLDLVASIPFFVFPLTKKYV